MSGKLSWNCTLSYQTTFFLRPFNWCLSCLKVKMVLQNLLSLFPGDLRAPGHSIFLQMGTSSTTPRFWEMIWWSLQQEGWIEASCFMLFAMFEVALTTWPIQTDGHGMLICLERTINPFSANTCMGLAPWPVLWAEIGSLRCPLGTSRRAVQGEVRCSKGAAVSLHSWYCLLHPPTCLCFGLCWRFWTAQRLYSRLLDGSQLWRTSFHPRLMLELSQNVRRSHTPLWYLWWTKWISDSIPLPTSANILCFTSNFSGSWRCSF